MTKIIVCGAGGHMGKTVTMLASAQPERYEIVCGIDKYADPTQFPFPVYKTLDECDCKADAIIDFSRPDALDGILSFCKRSNCGAVLCTTGYSDEQKAQIAKASETLPLFQTFNLSLGITLLANLVRKANEFLGDDYDIEIVEKHHNLKADSPSGTALMLASAVENRSESDYVFGRHSRDCKRSKREIGIHAVRGGTVVGEHEVMFLGPDEEITLSHRAQSKAVFARGALKAAEFLKGKPAGKYDMNDYIKEII